MSAPKTLITGNGDSAHSLVVIFLRGGADGLSLVAPLQDDGYYRARPRIAVGKNEAVKLDGFFGLNPLLKDLAPAYTDGALAIVHAVGSEDSTRSHFEAQDLIEHGRAVAGGCRCTPAAGVKNPNKFCCCSSFTVVTSEGIGPRSASALCTSFAPGEIAAVSSK